MIKYNFETYLDKLHACWLGKNIGGTIGAPYEGKREFLDIKGFASQSGEPLPNDDLDLQLVWLNAIENTGAKKLNANILSEYWLDWISPHWNEYGIAKTNLRMGILPPMSGEIDNDKWKNSNGAWIRSEIWASLAPCLPDVAVKYAVMDAMVDHGLGEGSNAEIFTAAIQSAAYYESDIKKLFDIALAKIPDTSMISKTVRLVMDCYDKGVDYRETREKVVELNEELGWFQAPANLGFVVIGLLYGEGDFEKSVIYAANCGDDTDCTAATVGATLGIIGGTKAIPEKLKNYVGDKIVTISINGMYSGFIPKNCTSLTKRISALVPDVMKANCVDFEFSQKENFLPKDELNKFNQLTSEDFLNRSPYSFDIFDSNYMDILVEIDKSPRIKPCEERKILVTFACKKHIQECRKLHFNILLPSGWNSSYYNRTLTLQYPQRVHGIYGVEKLDFSIFAGEKVDVINRVYLEITSSTIPMPIIVPITFLG